MHMAEHNYISLFRTQKKEIVLVWFANDIAVAGDSEILGQPDVCEEGGAEDGYVAQ